MGEVMSELNRKAFEEWAFQCAWLGLSDECMARDEINGGYYGLELHAAWLAWQASRADLVIELPDTYVAAAMTHDWQGYCRGVIECKSAIEAVGLKVSQ
jgi:hypothetical protein